MIKPRISFVRLHDGVRSCWRVLFPETSDRRIANRQVDCLRDFINRPGFLRGVIFDDRELKYAAFARVSELPDAVTIARQCAAWGHP